MKKLMPLALWILCFSTVALSFAPGVFSNDFSRNEAVQGDGSPALAESGSSAIAPVSAPVPMVQGLVFNPPPPGDPDRPPGPGGQ